VTSVTRDWTRETLATTTDEHRRFPNNVCPSCATGPVAPLLADLRPPTRVGTKLDATLEHRVDRETTLETLIAMAPAGEERRLGRSAAGGWAARR
jgi:hypothetical protein